MYQMSTEAHFLVEGVWQTTRGLPGWWRVMLPRVQVCFMTDYVCSQDSQLEKSLNMNRFYKKPKKKFREELWGHVDGKVQWQLQRKDENLVNHLGISALLQYGTQVSFSFISLSVHVYSHLAEWKKSCLPGTLCAPGFCVPVAVL